MEILNSSNSIESFFTNPFQENQFLCQKGGNLCIISNRSEILKNIQKGSFFSSNFQKRFHIFSKYYLIFHLIFCLVGSVSTQSWDGVVVTESDYQSLQAFKHELIDPNGFLKSWNDSGNGACSGSWLGIKCAKGQVIVIQLPWKGLRGRLTEKIGQFQSLRKLSLHNNAISGLIPTSLGFLPNLRGLQLFNNKFSGSIPHELGLCPLLQALDFSNNSLSGPIPYSIVNSTRLFRLNLSYNQLSGEIPVSVIKSSSLVLLSLEYNSLSGSIPYSFVRLSLLQDINLRHNQLSGVIPNGIDNLSQVEKLVLSDNFINGTLPITLYNLQKLRVLDLSYNNLSGEIPASLGDLPNLDSLNVSYNNLSGLVPVKLSQKFNSSAFVGNAQLCGYSSSTQCPIPTLTPPSQRPKKPRKLSTKDILLILAGVLFILLLFICFVLTWCLLRMRKTEKDVAEKTDSIEKGNVTSRGEMVESSEEAGGKLVHFDGTVSFSADDLLCANAEIMEKNSYGTVYRATMEDGIEVAVKRLKQRVTIEEMEFESEVSVLGKIRHPNLLALRAYYLGPKGEKLLVFYYMNKGSLATFLHGRSPNTRIDWPTRMRIAKGMARGLFYLHNNLHIIHGNLKSTNILLDDHQNPKVADYGLWRLMTDPTNANLINMAGALGYRAPELSNIKKVNAKTDVYSLGVIMLELLTGKPPGNLINGVDLPRWVASTVNGEWTNEVFDLELIRNESSVIGGELFNTLKLALHCVDAEPDLRPEAYEVLQQLEDIRPDVFSSSGDESVTFPSPGD